MRKIYLNGELRETATTSVGELVDSLELPSKRIAVEYNGEVLRRSAWHETSISDDDRLEVVHFVGGG